MDCWEELIRIVKPGGIVVMSVKEDVRKEANMDETFHNHVANGLWEIMVDEVIPAGWYMEKDAAIFVFRITKASI